MARHVPTENETPVYKVRLGEETLAQLDACALRLGRLTAQGRPNRAEAIRHLARQDAKSNSKKSTVRR